MGYMLKCRGAIGSLALVTLCLMVAVPQMASAQKEGDKAAKAAAKKDGAKKGRLPNYFAKVVDGEQREKIQAINEEYQPRISKAQAELAALREQRDEAILAVLRPEQRQQVEALRAEAKAKRQKKATAGKAAEKTSAKPAITASK